MDINFENIKKLYNKFWRDLSDYIIFLKNPKKYFDIIVNEPLKQNIKRLALRYLVWVIQMAYININGNAKLKISMNAV